MRAEPLAKERKTAQIRRVKELLALTADITKAKMQEGRKAAEAAADEAAEIHETNETR